MNIPTNSGRNAFRRVSGRELVKDLEAMDMDEIRRQQFAMRSFTDSVEVDDLPMPTPATSHLESRRLTCTSEEGGCWPDGNVEWQGDCSGDQGMRTSSTNNTIDTIIEIKPSKEEPSIDQQLGETQKYIMSVPGPGHVDQEIELHKSLLTESAETPGTTSSDEIESLAAVEALMDSAAGDLGTADSPRHSSSPTNSAQLPDHTAIRQEFNRVATQRPRPVTPTSWSALENYVVEGDNRAKDVDSAFVPISARIPPDCGAKIKVALPGQRDGSPHSGTFRGRQSSMSWSDFYDSMAGQQQAQSSELQDHDLLETNPAYAHKAPPKPVVNRRASVEWENFQENSHLQQAADENNASGYQGDRSGNEGDDQHQTHCPPPHWPSNQDGFDAVDEPALSNNHLPEKQYPSSEMYSGGGQDPSLVNNPFAVPQQENPFADPFSTAIAPTRAAPPPPVQPATSTYYPPPPSDSYSWGDTSTTNSAAAADPSNPYYSNTQYSNFYSGYDHDVPASTQNYGYDDQSSQVVPTGDPYSPYTSNPYSQQDVYSEEVAHDPYAQYGAQTTGYDSIDAHSTQPEAAQYNDTIYTAGYEGYSDAYVGYEQSPQVDISGYEESPQVHSTGYEQTPQVDITGTDTYGTSFEYNQEYGVRAEPVASVAAPTTFLGQPILPPQRSRTPDPFSWEVQETAYEQHGSAVAPPPRPPPITPSRTPEPRFVDAVLPVAGGLSPSGEEQMGGEMGTSKSPPPLRPAAPPPRPAAPSPSPVRPPPPSLSGSPFGERRAAEQAQKKQEEEEEDPWAKFKQMTEQVSTVVNKTTEQLSKLSEKSAADDIVDESYVAQVGGNQGFQLNSAQKQILQMQEDQKKQKADKKKRGKRPPSPTYDPNREQDLEKAAAELVRKMQSTRADLADWKPPSDSQVTLEQPESSQEPTVEQVERKESVKEAKETPETFADFTQEEPKEDPPAPIPNNWAGFGDDSGPVLPSSDSDFFQKALVEKSKATANVEAFDGEENVGTDPFGNIAVVDPFAPLPEPSLINESYDPFDTRPADEIIAQAKQRAELEQAKLEADRDLELYAASPTAKTGLDVSHLSSPTAEGGSPAPDIAERPTGFEDDFKAEAGEFSHTPSPLYDEDDSAPLGEFPEKFTGDGWELMFRYPPKKKIMADRYWKPCYVRIQGNTLLLYNDKKESKPFQEILLQASYSLSDVSLQAYDVYGKIHTVKLQHILYKERVGIRAGQISRLVEGHMTKYGLPLEHAAQSNVLAKFACLNGDELTTFTNCVEDLLFHCPAKRETNPVHKQDEVQIHCYDEYSAHVDKDGIVSDQKARVRMFCLAFLTGSPFLEIGLNDRRRQGKEIVRRKDILPMYTERWIRFENLEFHKTVDEKTWEEDQVVKIQPPDGCFFEMMRFRVRPPRNREKPLTVKCVMRLAGSKIEIRIDAMAAAQQQRAKGTTESTRTIPCEDIQIRFPIPEAWIYIFREERHWGVGSVHSKVRRPGKVKNLKDRLMGAVQQTETTLIEVATGEAKYEHLYRSLVWRIPRLPEKHHAAYKTHMLKCRFELSSFDLMPETFLPSSNVEFTMPLATISNTVVRSVGVEQHEDSDRVEKFVRYVAKCHHRVDIDYVQCNDLDDVETSTFAQSAALEEADPEAVPQHVSAFDPQDVQSQHMGYRIDFNQSDFGQNGGGSGRGGGIGGGLDMGGGGAIGAIGGGDQSSSEEEEGVKKVPIIEINMKGYGY